MNDEQYKRYRKMTNEPIECLFHLRKNEVLYFLISGSSDTHYKVRIPQNGRISCSCPDFTHTCSVQECVCKHCLYVLLVVLKVFTDLQHTFFTRRFLTPDEVQSAHSSYRELKPFKKATPK
jgi:hypothetical protein